ncbi:MAG: HD domain-containing protein [Bacteroidales bacterium]|nr:HD domain-containing protein [Bacteroidales bacterium]MBN2699534.1 HD domain-containing protein [Bacteroidales bacterium]
MMNPALIDSAKAFVKSRLEGAESGHDWFHIERVWKMARVIRKMEKKGDILIIELAALLHDIADPKFNDAYHDRSADTAYDFLIAEGLNRDKAAQVKAIINHISFKGGIDPARIDTIEFKIVQDADRLDAMGAIGIARAFNYGGFKNRPIHDPEIPLQNYRSSKEYHASAAPTINHFYEKLLRLKDLMNTDSGRKIASERHRYMEQFLQQFFREWNFQPRND